MVGYETGTRVEWHWGSGTARGRITARYKEKVSKTIKGTEVTRDASAQEPAYLIEQEDGDEVLKSHSEVSKTS